MVFIQDILRAGQVDGGEFRRLPRQACDKVKVIIQKPVFMALFPFLAHTVQHFFRLSARLFVHAGLCDLFLKFPYI